MPFEKIILPCPDKKILLILDTQAMQKPGVRSTYMSRILKNNPPARHGCRRKRQKGDVIPAED